MAHGLVFKGGDTGIQKNPVLDRMDEFLGSAERNGYPNPDVQGGKGLSYEEGMHGVGVTKTVGYAFSGVFPIPEYGLLRNRYGMIQFDHISTF